MLVVSQVNIYKDMTKSLKNVYPIAEIFKTNSGDKNRPQYAG